MHGHHQRRAASTLLVVCTANVCRSPLAQRVLQRAFAGAGWLGAVEVVSAGTRAEDGWGMCATSATELPDPAEDASFAAAHRSRAVTKELVRDAGLVIAMEREQRSAIAQLVPGSQSKVYTLREIESLTAVLAERDAESPADLPALASALHSVRGFAPPPEPVTPKRRWFQRPEEPEDPLTIADGHGLADDRHLTAAQTVRSTASSVAKGLRSLVAA